LTLYFSQGSVAADLKGGGSFNPGFLRRFFLNLTVKKYENWSTFAEVLPFGARRSGNYDSSRRRFSTASKCPVCRRQFGGYCL